ncbi:hypothetical protein C0J52_15713 [Blattella germanica]|nr:hypothetical protein C0J52_15713 [Blattella germanica]
MWYSFVDFCLRISINMDYKGNEREPRFIYESFEGQKGEGSHVGMRLDWSKMGFSITAQLFGTKCTQKQNDATMAAVGEMYSTAPLVSGCFTCNDNKK